MTGPGPVDGVGPGTMDSAVAGSWLGDKAAFEAAATRPGTSRPPFSATKAIETAAHTTVKAVARSTAGVSVRRGGGPLRASPRPPLPRLAGGPSTFSAWLWRSG